MKKTVFVVAIIACIVFGCLIWPTFNVCASDKKSSPQESKKIIRIYSGFLTGLDYINMDDDEKDAYACGIIDGILVSPYFGAKVEKFHSCISGMSNAQIAAIISKYLDGHPEKWHEPLHITVVISFSEICNIYVRP